MLFFLQERVVRTILDIYMVMLYSIIIPEFTIKDSTHISFSKIKNITFYILSFALKYEIIHRYYLIHTLKQNVPK
jgi:hypothetical protein